MDKQFSIEELDKLYLRGKLSEDEYIHLATDDVHVLAIAVDKIDGITTVSLTKEASKFCGEILYPLEQTYLDEKFLKNEASLKDACQKFINKVASLERGRGHEFEVTWYFQKSKDM
jgi:hypothetical protein